MWKKPLEHTVACWNRYWFGLDARLSVAVLRIAIAVAVLMSLDRVHTCYHLKNLDKLPAEVYQPTGILGLLGTSIPPAWFFTTCAYVAVAATVLMLVGLATRTSTAVSLITSLCVVSLAYSFKAGWHKTYCVVFIAQTAFLFARGGDVLGLDGLIARLRRRPVTAERRNYGWNVLLVQVGVALMFLNAAYWKLHEADFTLAWAFSDNLRHQLFARYHWQDQTPPPLVEWVMAHPWRYQGAALGNLLCQMLPIVACVFTRQPLVRLFCGICFVCEAIGLGLLIGLWEYQWLPLAVVFVDWDWLAGVCAGRRKTSPSFLAAGGRGQVEGEEKPKAILRPLLLATTRSCKFAASPFTPWRKLACSAFIVAFIGYYAFVAFDTEKTAYEMNSFPFSSFPMYRQIRAEAPYDQHHDYARLAVRVDIHSDTPVSDRLERWANRKVRHLYNAKKPEQIHAQLTTILARLRKANPECSINGVSLRRVVCRLPAYPAPPEAEEIDLGRIAKLDSQGMFETALAEPKVDGQNGQEYLELQIAGYDEPRVWITYMRDLTEGPYFLAGRQQGDRYYFDRKEPVAGERLYLVHVVEPVSNERVTIASLPGRVAKDVE